MQHRSKAAAAAVPPPGPSHPQRRSPRRALEAEDGERGETAVAMLRPAVGLEAQARESEPIALTVSLGVDHPARELRKPRLRIERCEPRILEHPQLGGSLHVLLDEQRRLAR